MTERLGIFLPSFAGGGAENAMLMLAHGLSARGYAVDAIVARAEGPHKSGVDERVRVIDLNVPRTVLAVPKLVHYLRAVRPLVLVSTLDYANVIALCARSIARVPTRILVLEQNTISISSRRSKQWRHRIVPRLVRYSYRSADWIVGNSLGVARDLMTITGLPRERISVIYNPIVTSTLHQASKIQPPDPWFAAGEPPVIIAAGRLAPQKDFVTLVNAFAEVRRSRPARLLILGEGAERPRLEALVRRLKLEADVRLPGFVANPYPYMSHAAVFALSSRWEGLPTVLIEALACGTPVVATDCPSGPREILADGRYGRLVPVGGVSALAQAIAETLSGRTPPPQADSWRPYELNTVVDQYCRLCFGGPQPHHV